MPFVTVQGAPSSQLLTLLTRVLLLDGKKKKVHFLPFSAVPHGLRDLSSPTRDRSQALGSESVES